MSEKLKALAVARIAVSNAIGRYILDDTSDRESADWTNREHLLAKAHKEIRAEEKEVVQGYVSYSSGDYIERGGERNNTLDDLSSDTVEFIIELIGEYRRSLNEAALSEIGTNLDLAETEFKELLKEFG